MTYHEEGSLRLSENRKFYVQILESWVEGMWKRTWVVCFSKPLELGSKGIRGGADLPSAYSVLCIHSSTFGHFLYLRHNRSLSEEGIVCTFLCIFKRRSKQLLVLLLGSWKNVCACKEFWSLSIIMFSIKPLLIQFPPPCPFSPPFLKKKQANMCKYPYPLFLRWKRKCCIFFSSLNYHCILEMDRTTVHWIIFIPFHSCIVLHLEDTPWFILYQQTFDSFSVFYSLNNESMNGLEYHLKFFANVALG